MLRIVFLVLMMVGFMPENSEAVDLDKENMIYLDIEAGRIVILMRPDVAPNHVARVKELARAGFYDGTIFHRVIPGFMAQGGDPKGTGVGGSGQNIDAEFNRLPHMRGTVSMARSQDENSADSQFFIVLDRSPFLDDKYTIWGRVIKGMEFVDMIEQGEPPRNPTKIVHMRVAADVDK
jgi:cyclophilin family peptidyl-prolyl cis-trans isomerase